MPKTVHRLLEKDVNKLVGVCRNCGNVSLRVKGNGVRCDVGRRHQTGARRSRAQYRGVFTTLKEWTCRVCYVKDTDMRFFDVDHVDSDHNNNSENNLQLLCPSCHRRKTITLWDSWKK